MGLIKKVVGLLIALAILKTILLPSNQATGAEIFDDPKNVKLNSTEILTLNRLKTDEEKRVLF